MKIIDARQLACPAPVLAAKQAVEAEHPKRIEVIVDNDAARQNVSRFLTSRGYAVSAAAEGPDVRVTAIRGPASEHQADATNEPQTARDPALSGNEVRGVQKILVMAATDRIGFGDDALGKKLMISFLKTLKEMGPDLWRLVLVNNGVKLAVSGAETLADLRELAESGVTILVCGTCLTHFGLLTAKQVGETTNMLDIVTAMQLADKVITI